MASTGNGISGVGLAAIVFGAIAVYAGVQNRSMVESLRYLAMGQAIPAGPQKQTSVTGISTAGLGGGDGNVVAIAATYKGRPYVFGGGHGKVCPPGGLDCSGYVSCVLNRAGLLNGTLTTDGLAKWGSAVPFDQRRPGDVLVWIGGPGGGHCGIVVNGETMWHSPCTGCGGVQIGRYGTTRSGRTTLVRRASAAPRTVSV